MRTYALALFLSLYAAANAAQTYRWVDGHGVTNYGEKPPAGRSAQLVDSRPAGTVESQGLALSRASQSFTAPADGVPAVPTSSARAPRGMAFETYIRLQTGMSEGEVLLRAGEPDHLSVQNTHHDTAKSLYYYPTPANPHITIITLRGGRVTAIERNRKTH